MADPKQDCSKNNFLVDGRLPRRKAYPAGAPVAIEVRILRRCGKPLDVYRFAHRARRALIHPIE